MFIDCASIDKSYFNVYLLLLLNNGFLFKIFQKILTADISKEAFPMNVALTSMLDNNINDKLKWFASRKIYF